MKQRIGIFLTQRTAGGSFPAYIPPALPPEPAVDMAALYPMLDKAKRALTELDSIHRTVPNTALFIYIFVRKEALLSSQIEGTQSSLSDVLLFEHQVEPDVAISDVEEVSNYVKAMNHGLQRLSGGFPLSLRLLREMHSVLFSGGGGLRKQPGEFRRSQNWIGGSRPGNAMYVPPPADAMHQCLHDFEKFLYDQSLPALIKIGLAHVQFESIHPFLDGNGRLGRLLIVLLLCYEGLIDEPVLYISLYLKENRHVYYDLLQEVRTRGAWEAWLEFFLLGIYTSAKQAIATMKRINTILEEDSEKIAQLGGAKLSCEQAFAYLKRLPVVTAPGLAKALQWSVPTARSALTQMTSLGILTETSGRKWRKTYVYRTYLDILEEGTQPLPI